MQKKKNGGKAGRYISSPLVQRVERERPQVVAGGANQAKGGRVKRW